MTRTQRREIGQKLAQHKGEWVVLDGSRLVSHAPKLKDAIANVPKNSGKPAVYYSSATTADMVLTSF